MRRLCSLQRAADATNRVRHALQQAVIAPGMAGDRTYLNKMARPTWPATEKELPMRVMRTAALGLLIGLQTLVPWTSAANAGIPIDPATAISGLSGNATPVRLICDSYGCRDVGPRRQPRRYRPPPAVGSDDRPINPRPPGYYRPPPRPGYSQPRTPPQRYRPAPLPRYGIGKD
jgi:hypothetical protein